MPNLFKTFFQNRSLKPFLETVRRANELEAEISALSDDALKAMSGELKASLRGGNRSMEEVMPRAFAIAREAARRTLGQRPYDVQLLGSAVLHSGAVAEMSTGEGKTLAAVPAVYLNALSGGGVHVVTVNEYLARRDAVWMGRIYNFLGLSVACLVPQGAFMYDPEWRVPEGQGEMLAEEEKTRGSFLVQQEYLRPISRREAYQADIIHGTNHEFGFDYLRDNLAYQLEGQVQPRRFDAKMPEDHSEHAKQNKSHYFAVIDEVDSILIDEARTPLIISAPDTESSELYKTFTRVVSNLVAEEDYKVDEKLKSVSITPPGIAKVERQMSVDNIYSAENLRLVRYLEECLRAKALFKLDRDYVVKNGEIVIVDEFTGRLLQGRRYNGGLHQAIEAKEGVLVKEESRTYAKISIQNYFRLYQKISGMTGTAQTSAEEFHKVYGLEVFSIPTNKPCVRDDRTDVIYKNFEVKLRAIVRDIQAAREKGQPVLVGTTSIAKNEIVSDALSQAGIPHEVLNAKNNEREGAIIAQAGRKGAVTVATNMAGRGVDIILGGNPPVAEEAQLVREAGGLHVIGTERHEARRIDNQLRGRAGRQGDPGSSQFYLSLDDDLLRIFGGERIKGLMERFNLPEDEPIRLGFVSGAVQEAQAKVEGANFDMRKHLLEYDDVLNKQRAAVYKKRQQILTSITREQLGQVVFEAAHGCLMHASGGVQENGEPITIEDLKSGMEKAGIATAERPVPEGAEQPEDLEEFLRTRSLEVAHDPQTFTRVLQILDMLWMNHLDDLEAVSESVGLRAYGQRDPLVEYRQEASRLYKTFWVNFNEWIFANIYKLATSQQPAASSERKSDSAPGINLQAARTNVSESGSSSQGAHSEKVGRNDPCPCGAKKADGTPVKYKHCHGKNA